MIASRHHILERYYFTLFLCFQERSKKRLQMKFAMPLQQMVRSSCHRRDIVHGSTFLSSDGDCPTVCQNLVYSQVISARKLNIVREVTLLRVYLMNGIKLYTVKPHLSVFLCLSLRTVSGKSRSGLENNCFAYFYIKAEMKKLLSV